MAAHLPVPFPDVGELVRDFLCAGQLRRLATGALPDLHQAGAQALLRAFWLQVEPELCFGGFSELLDLCAKKSARLLAA